MYSEDYKTYLNGNYLCKTIFFILQNTLLSNVSGIAYKGFGVGERVLLLIFVIIYFFL